MISIKQINNKDIDLCYEFDLNTISLWSRNQWETELKKEGAKVFSLVLANLVVGVCVFQEVLDEAQINYFVVNQKFRKRGFGSQLIRFLINNPKIIVPSFLNSLAHCFLLHSEIVFKSKS